MENSQQKPREKFSSRLGFILISAGCAIGLGNVYRFPIITGAYGGALFVIFYIFFLLILGIPIMTAELAVGRASRRSIASSFQTLEKPGQKWHLAKYLGIGGNYLLMMFYTCISSWMIIYFFKFLFGSAIIENATAENLGVLFEQTITNTPLILLATFGVIVVCFGICSFGLQKGVERVSKVMMVLLFILLIGLVVYCLTLSGAGAGLQFYLVPNVESMQKSGIFTIITAAMGQSFFSLSIGIGSISIFGSYMGNDRRLLGETVSIISLDTFVALMSGLIIFPACFTYNNGVTADAGTVGAGFLFTTLSSIFNNMPGASGRIIGTLFFLFMIFASLSTVIAVFENIMSFWLEKTKLSRIKIALINVLLVTALSLPAILGLSVWSNVAVLGKGILDLEDFIVSNIFLPLGSIIYVVFCTSKYGWGWDNFHKQVNIGEKGMRFPKWLRVYMTYVLPIIILFLLIVSVI